MNVHRNRTRIGHGFCGRSWAHRRNDAASGTVGHSLFADGFGQLLTRDLDKVRIHASLSAPLPIFSSRLVCGIVLGSEQARIIHLLFRYMPLWKVAYRDGKQAGSVCLKDISTCFQIWNQFIEKFLEASAESRVALPAERDKKLFVFCDEADLDKVRQPHGAYGVLLALSDIIRPIYLGMSLKKK